MGPPLKGWFINPMVQYPLVNEQLALENGHRKFVDLPIENGDFP